MKRFRETRGERWMAGILLSLGICGAGLGQEPPTPTAAGAVVSAQPGQRTPMPLPAAQADGVHLSLSQAIGLALANNQDLNVTVAAAEASRFFLFENQGIFDPLLQASATRAHSDTPTASTLQAGTGAVVQTSDTVDASLGVTQLTPWGGTFTLGFSGNRTATNSAFFFVNPSYTANLSLQATQPLLRNFGKLATEWQIYTARDARDAAYQGFVQSVQATVNTVEQAYWDLAYAYENLKVKQETKDLRVEQNRITRIKIDVGSLAPIDIVQTEADIATAEQDIISAEGAIGTAQDQLKRLLNVDPKNWGNAPIIPTDPVRVEQPPFDLEQGMRTALERRPEILAQYYTVSADETRYAYWSDQTLPRLDLVAAYGRNGLEGRTFDQNGNVISNNNFFDAASQIFNENFKSWKVGFVFSYPLFNRVARGQKGVAQYNLETDKARLTVLELDVIVGVRNAHRAINIAQRQIGAAAKGRELAERNLDAARKKFENGMSTSFEVSQITNQLSDARSRELNALVIYRKAIAAYHQAIADSLDWKGVKIEGMPEMAPPPIETRADLLRSALASDSTGAP